MGFNPKSYRLHENHEITQLWDLALEKVKMGSYLVIECSSEKDAMGMQIKLCNHRKAYESQIADPVSLMKYKGLKVRRPKLIGKSTRNEVLIVGAFDNYFIRDVTLRDGITGDEVGVDNE